jgi:DNA uptake protein ComE-like DNA-binding protein
MVIKIESGHGLLYLSQIVESQEQSKAEKSEVEEISKSITDWGFNLALPIVCLTSEEEKYRLITGLPIYEAAKQAGVKQIWVCLIATDRLNAEKAIEEAQLQSNLNQRLIEPEDLEDFRKFLNKAEISVLTSIPGIKEGYAKKIKDQRPFNSVDELHKKIGAKLPLKWLKAYVKVKNSLKA